MPRIQRLAERVRQIAEATGGEKASIIARSNDSIVKRRPVFQGGVFDKVDRSLSRNHTIRLAAMYFLALLLVTRLLYST